MRKTLQRKFKVDKHFLIILCIVIVLFGGFLHICPELFSLQGSVFICFDTEESSKQFLERSDIKSYKDNEMLVLSRYKCALNQHLLVKD